MAGVTSIPGLAAPEYTNQGHDFVALQWTPRDVGAVSGVIGHRVYRSRWLPSFVARYAPLFSGVYAMDDYHIGGHVEICTRQDGILGEGRLAIYIHSKDGGFNAFGAGRWDTRQGGYSGVLLHSNSTAHSGPFLIYKPATAGYACATIRLWWRISSRTYLRFQTEAGRDRDRHGRVWPAARVRDAAATAEALQDGVQLAVGRSVAEQQSL